MSVEMHPAAPHHLPGFITAPGESDVLMISSVVLLVVLTMALGSLYFWLHSLPERIAHGSGKVQFQLVGVLCLLALFTHNNLFWVAALFLALVPIPDFWTPLANMADSLARMAARSRREALPDPGLTTSEPKELGADVVILTGDIDRPRPKHEEIGAQPDAARARQQMSEGR